MAPCSGRQRRKTRKRPQVAFRRTGQLLGAASSFRIPVSAPRGVTLIRIPERPSTSVPGPDSSTGPRWDPGRPFCPSARRRNSPVDLAPESGLTVGPLDARRRRDDLRWPGPGRGLTRSVWLLARRLVAAPPGLDTLVPVAEPLVPLGPSVVAVLPEHTSGASPGSRPSSCDRSLSSCPIRLAGSPVPDPLAVFGVTGRMHSSMAFVNRKASIPQKHGRFPHPGGEWSTGPSTDRPTNGTERQSAG